MISNSIRTPRVLLCALLTASSLNGCAARTVVDVQPSDPCTVGDDAAERDVRFALAAPAAADFIAAQLYETLVRVDCAGVVQPGLAMSWSDSAGIAWRFELRRDVTFTDGAPVDAQAVLRSWTGEGRTVATSFAALSAEGVHVLRVLLHDPARVQLFATRELSVTSDDGAAVPAGSTPWLVTSPQPPRLGSTSGRTLTPLLYEDLRAALNDDVHGLVTDDIDVIAWARTRPGYRTAPLPWTRTYVIATAGARAEPRLPDEVLETFARDVVRGEVRAAQPPFWWESTACGPPGVRFSNPQARDIVYPRDDRVAQSLAERIAALAWPVSSAPAWVRDLLPAGYGSAGAPRARGLDDGALLTAIRARLPLTVVAPVPVLFDRACMRAARDSDVRALLSSGWQLTPAVDARDLLIFRPGLGRVVVDGLGGVWIDPQ